MPQESVEWVQLDWGTQLRHALECYNVTMEDGDEDPKNIHIPKSEGKHEVKGPKAEIPSISDPLKTKEVNIGSDVQPEFTNISDYWEKDTLNKVVNLL